MDIQERFKLYLHCEKVRDVGVEFLSDTTARVPYGEMPINFKTARHLIMRVPREFLMDAGLKRPEALVEGKNYRFKTDGYCYFTFEQSGVRQIVYYDAHI